MADVIKHTAQYNSLQKRQEFNLDKSYYGAKQPAGANQNLGSPTKIREGAARQMSSPRRGKKDLGLKGYISSDQKTGKAVAQDGTGKKDKEIKFNYYDPQAYDDPHQFYQWHKERVQMDLCGRKSPRRNPVEDFESTILTELTYPQ